MLLVLWPLSTYSTNTCSTLTMLALTIILSVLCTITRKLHSVSDISRRDAAGVQSHFGPGGWCPWWPPGCQVGSRRRTTWPPKQHPLISHHPPSGSTHDNWGEEQGEMRVGCRAFKKKKNLTQMFFDTFPVRLILFPLSDSWDGNQLWHDKSFLRPLKAWLLIFTPASETSLRQESHRVTEIISQYINLLFIYLFEMRCHCDGNWINLWW